MRTIQEERCTGIMGPPIIFHDLLQHPKRKEYDMNSLLFGIIGAAPVNPILMERLEREIPIKCISQVYGQTESSGPVTVSVFAGDNRQRRYNSVGKIMPHVEVKIIDSNNRILPIGEEGEICARGYNIMQGNPLLNAIYSFYLLISSGYYGDEEKTRETITSSGWLKTGDLGVMDEDGYVYYRSRLKELIIVGGINIFPMEIENYLLEHPKIIQAEVFGIPDERYGEVVCAWVREKPDTRINDVEEVKQFLATRLAFFKVPKYVKVIESFVPFSAPSGKVQKFKLTEAMINELSKVSS